MLGGLRSVQNSWIGKIGMALIFILIIVGLSFFGFADLFRTRSASWVAQVGGRDVSVDDYRHAYQIALQQLQQRLRRPVTNQQARQIGLDQQVLSRLVSDAILDNESDRLGLSISEAQIGQAIVQDPTFAGANGQFDRERFNTLLRNNGLTEQAFIRDQQQNYVRRELIDGVAGGLAVPKAALEALHRLEAETRSLDMIVLQPTVVGDAPAPDAAVLEKYYNDHNESFAAPEYRKLVLLATSPTSVAKPDAVSEDEIQHVYDADPENRYGQPERRTLQQIVFPTEAEAQAASTAIKGGKSFADIAAERKLTAKEIDLGTVTKGTVFDKAIADAAFALPVDGTSDPVKGTFGTVLVHVTAIEPGSKKSLQEVASDIRQTIATSPARTRDALRDLRDKIEDQRSSGRPLAEAAKAIGLETRTIDAVDATGHDPSGAAVDIPDRDDVLKAAFASDVGVDNDVVQSRTGDQIWFEVAAIERAHQRKFEEVRPQVETAWRREDTAKRLATKADDLVKALDGGETPEAVASSLGGAAVKHVADLKRSGAADVPGPVAVRAFDTPVGKAGSADANDGTRIVFKVLDSVVPPLDPDEPQTAQLQDQYRNVFADDLIGGYLSRLEATTNVKVNPTALNSIVGGES
jgi:peptidyl-prolyl cis-trans isomerase D